MTAEDLWFLCGVIMIAIGLEYKLIFIGVFGIILIGLAFLCSKYEE